MFVNPYVEREQLAPDQYQATLHLAPVAYDDGGTLKAIDSAWQDSGSPTLPHIVSAAPFLVTVGEGGARRFHPTRELDRYFEIGRPWAIIGGQPQPAPLNALVRDGNRLASTNNNYNLTLVMGGHYCKLEIELKNGFVPNQNMFAFPVDLQGFTRQGGTILDNGQPVMRLRSPDVYDGNNPADRRDIAWDLQQVAGQPMVVFTLPSLAGMARPIVDPAFESQPGAAAGIDTYLNSSSPTSNFGTANTIIERQADFRSLVKFDLSSIPAGATIVSAIYHLWNNFVNATNVTIDIHRIKAANGDWTEGGATWNTRDGGNAWAGSAGCSTAGTDYETTPIGSFTFVGGTPNTSENQASLNTAQVAALLTANYGWVGIRPVSGNPSTAWYTSDHETAAERPKLSVTYSLPLGSGRARFFGYLPPVLRRPGRLKGFGI